jgi:hypothetical protein
MRRNYRHVKLAVRFQNEDPDEGRMMAGKADFTEQEWETLQKGVTGSAMLVSVADRGFFDTFREVGALTKHLTEARKQSETPLIKELAEIRGTGFGFTTSPEEVETETMGALHSAVGTLQTKAPNEVQAYQDFVLNVAKSVAAAADDVGATETGALEKIETALQTA